MIKVMEPQIKKALPEVITPERFTRMALSALNTTPKLNECTPMSFLAALMNAAQLGLEPNTPLGQAFLIPYNNKGEMECQFQLGYKGLIDLSYRNPNMQIITAHTVYENDEFEYELGLNPCLNHRPTLGERGEIRLFYGLFKLTNGGFGFEVMSKTAMDDFAKEYSKAFDSSFSPWRTNYESMALKTIIKKALKYKRHICDNCLRRFKDIESLKKTDLNRALNLIDLLEQDSIKEARPGLDRYKESITKQYNAHKEAEAEQNKRDALEVEKSPDIIVTTCDLKQEYEVIAPVYFQLSNKGVFSSTFSKLSR